MHRDPRETIPSGASLNATLHAMHADDVDRHRVGAEWLERMGWTNDRAMAARDGWGDETARCTDIEFADAVADPIGQVARVYDAIGAAADRRRRIGDAPLAGRAPARAGAPAVRGRRLRAERRPDRRAVRGLQLSIPLRSNPLEEDVMSDFTGDPVATASQHEQELAALELTEPPDGARRRTAASPRPGSGGRRHPTRCASASTTRSPR